MSWLCSSFRPPCSVDPDSPHLNNNFAWFLANCPDSRYSDPRRAVELAKNAVDLVPDEGTFWNTLGVAHYRAGNWQAAIDALERSSQYFGDAGIGFNAVFLAMSQWQLGQREEANRQYDAAVRWMRDNDVDDEELLRFRQEAADLLGRTEAEQDGPANVKSPIHE